MRAAHPDLRPLVILHVNRTKPHPSQRAAAAAVLGRLQAAGCFYATPAGSNDDWYWMYAAVAAGPRGLLVSNDEMRDHMFQLLAPRYFARWKQRHQVRYHFAAGGDLALDYPPPYTTCAQRLEGGAWVFPGAGGAWLCAAPAPAAEGKEEEGAAEVALQSAGG
jgi:proteinaceous RNase P